VDWILVRGTRVFRISDEPERVDPVHEPKDEKQRREAREAQRRRDYSVRGELEALEAFAESLSPGPEVEVEPGEPSTATVSAAPAPASNPRAATQAQAFVEAAQDGTPLCEN
jgi:hypothetical protein